MLFEFQSNTDSANHAYINGIAATRSIPKTEQKALGQYMTPPAIAEFMARRAVQGLSTATIRVLEPAAGSGVLAATVVEALLESTDIPERMELLLYEIDARLIPGLRHVCESLKIKCVAQGVDLDYVIANEDFLLSAVARQQQPLVDLVIGNPPYFKLGKLDPRVTAHSYAVWGQPNIYGLFMAACSGLLRTGGRYCFITPRSWMSGPYFSAMRRHLLAHLRLDGFHVFDSRCAHFSEDEVLQEAVITWGTARAQEGPITISTSYGTKDLDTARVQHLPPSLLVSATSDRVIRLPSPEKPESSPKLTHTFARHGLKVSTGPVVAFRAAAFLRHEKGKDSVPLLWLQHVKSMAIEWPIKKKREHIAARAQNAWMLLKNEPMVILRRFSPKENVRRVTAAPYFGNLPGSVLGIENHLNYISRPGGTMSVKEVTGLAAFLNSRGVSEYFQAVSGHTQVNASDLRILPLPSLAELEEIGSITKTHSSPEAIDRIVAQVLGLPVTAKQALNLLHA
ncbi:MAG: Eco57I restriction-modification methylase domain-containing protein [Polaromonas sp.]